jgi:hypothetical protein
MQDHAHTAQEDFEIAQNQSMKNTNQIKLGKSSLSKLE